MTQDAVSDALALHHTPPTSPPRSLAAPTSCSPLALPHAKSLACIGEVQTSAAARHPAQYATSFALVTPPFSFRPPPSTLRGPQLRAAVLRSSPSPPHSFRRELRRPRSLGSRGPRFPPRARRRSTLCALRALIPGTQDRRIKQARRGSVERSAARASARRAVFHQTPRARVRAYEATHTSDGPLARC
ncbi:hypothetical protein HYPSUDRAFT_212250 [Hypholoma sublateritium FD-334 SS-4]|uniref:Uncharacterized protein n=1 Tax=Hypholoma sublateritium (strain FD-334 SS-4) TaxID=945553 RepID=A0A0D2P9R1_HYPSF|nr:hypothetical protein HYPSUDRAFT_212250 [Hypholoma sublateritium FD-334 SS-4]